MTFALVEEVGSFRRGVNVRGSSKKEVKSKVLEFVTPFVSSGARVKFNDTTNARHPPIEAAFCGRAQAFCRNMIFVAICF